MEFTLEIKEVPDLFVQCSLAIPKFTDAGFYSTYINHFRCGHSASYAVVDDETSAYMYRCSDHRDIQRMYANGSVIKGDFTTTVPSRKRVEEDGL